MTTYDDLFQRINPILESQAKYVACLCQRFSGAVIDWEDLAQASRIALWRYAERRPGTPLRILLILSRLFMYSERTRGRSVLRAHPGKRKRTYERASLDQADACISYELEPSPTLDDVRERDLLIALLHQARVDANDQAEHVAILALRRLARAMQDADLVGDCNEQLREWWRRHRLQDEEREEARA